MKSLDVSYNKIDVYSNTFKGYRTDSATLEEVNLTGNNHLNGNFPTVIDLLSGKFPSTNFINKSRTKKFSHRRVSAKPRKHKIPKAPLTHRRLGSSNKRNMKCFPTPNRKGNRGN